MKYLPPPTQLRLIWTAPYKLPLNLKVSTVASNRQSPTNPRCYLQCPNLTLTIVQIAQKPALSPQSSITTLTISSPFESRFKWCATKRSVAGEARVWTIELEVKGWCCSGDHYEGFVDDRHGWTVHGTVERFMANFAEHGRHAFLTHEKEISWLNSVCTYLLSYLRSS